MQSNLHVCSGWMRVLQVSEDTYQALVAGPNINRQVDEPSARTVEDAISLLSTSDATPEDRHPERYADISLDTSCIVGACRRAGCICLVTSMVGPGTNMDIADAICHLAPSADVFVCMPPLQSQARLALSLCFC